MAATCARGALWPALTAVGTWSATAGRGAGRSLCQAGVARLAGGDAHPTHAGDAHPTHAGDTHPTHAGDAHTTHPPRQAGAGGVG